MSGYCDSNTGPSGPKPDALTNCATPRLLVSLSFGTANIDTKNKSAKLFYKILHFFYSWIPDQVGDDEIPVKDDIILFVIAGFGRLSLLLIKG